MNIELANSINYLSWYFEDDNGRADKAAVRAYNVLLENIFKRTSDDYNALVRHGRWIPINRGNLSWAQMGIAQHKCSVCASEELVARKWCPECGAKMDKERSTGI